MASSGKDALRTLIDDKNAIFSVPFKSLFRGPDLTRNFPILRRNYQSKGVVKRAHLDRWVVDPNLPAAEAVF